MIIKRKDKVMSVPIATTFWVVVILLTITAIQ